MAAHQLLRPFSAITAALALLSTASAGAVLGPVTPAPARNALATRQTTVFVNFFKGPGCADEDFIVALATNEGNIAGPENCVEHQSQQHFADQQQDDGSYRVFMKPTTGAIFGGSGLCILRTPVEIVDEDFCGLARQRMTDAGACYDATLSNSFVLQTCLKDQGCVPEAKSIIRNIEKESPVEIVEKRQDPSCYSISRNDYTVADTQQSMIAASAIDCPGPESCEKSVSFTQSWTFTVSASVTAGIEGLFSATMGVEFSQGEERQTQTTFTVAPAQQGSIIWTPIKTCKFGTTSGCGEGISDGELEMCQVKTLASGEPNGIYSFVEGGKKIRDVLDAIKI